MTSETIGRFAPSPTGPLHIGSLVAAVGSYLQAKSKNGKWLVRMEDLDPPREEAGATDKILHSLEAHGLHWDGDVLYQSQRHEAYEAVIEHLIKNKLAYPCGCSRKTLQATATAKKGNYGLIYPGTCRNGVTENNQQTAIRIRTHNDHISFIDQRIGNYGQHLESETGDFIIKRADGLFAYQIAVVVDDEWQGVTEVVRGEDLLDNTPRQIHLRNLLNYSTPDYCHLPLVKNNQGQKLSKQTHAFALDNNQSSNNLETAIKFLGMDLPLEFQGANPSDILQWAQENWIIKKPVSSTA